MNEQNRLEIWISMIVAALAVLLMVFLLWREAPEPLVNTRTVEPTPTEETGIEPGDVAPDFRLAGLDLQEVRLNDHRGQHKVLLNFFTSWCVPCREEMPGVQSQFEKHEPHGWIVIGVSIQEPVSDVITFRDELGLTFSLALDVSGHVAYKYAVMGTPTNLTIDTNGRIVDRRLGYMSEEELEAMIEAVQ